MLTNLPSHRQIPPQAKSSTTETGWPTLAVFARVGCPGPNRKQVRVRSTQTKSANKRQQKQRTILKIEDSPRETSDFSPLIEQLNNAEGCDLGHMNGAWLAYNYKFAG